jgi:predicted O-linked N-acetylglucosamine transferase (SPINDLY family)
VNELAIRLQALRQAATARFRNGEFEAAEQLIGEALKLDPNSPELWSNRGTAQVFLGRREAALESFGQALRLKPDFSGAVAHRAHILFELQRYAEAIPDYEKLLARDPGHAYSAGDLIFCKLQCCDWSSFESDRNSILARLRVGQRVVPPVLSVALLESAADQLAAARIVARDKFPPVPPLWRGETYRHERIRVAYVSADFHAHATAVLTAGLFEHHDRRRFETVAISFGREDGSRLRDRLKQAFERFIDVRSRSDAEVARLMRELEIDIAVDLKGYTSEARPAVFAFRPAPLQVNYLGFPGTMGAAFMDYLIADPIVAPEEHKAFYGEQIVWLPDTYQANDRSRETAEGPIDRASAGLPPSGFVFCCFNNSYKIQPPMFDVWMRLLRSVEGSVLWLLADNAAATRNLKQEAAARGIDPERLVFAPRRDLPEHLARHRLADLFLDTLPYNAHTTASDALWAGLPIVTCKGNTFAGRVAASLLRAVGLPELVTESLVDYEALALRFARDPSALAAIRSKLSQNRETMPLFDAPRFTRHLEAAYVTMYERHQRGQSPASFAVNQVMAAAQSR